MEEKIDFLIQTKNWDELTADEKTLVIKELGSEAAFHSFKEVNERLADSERSSVLPDRPVFVSLRSRMKEKHRPVSRLQKVLLFPVPGYAFVLLGFALAFIFKNGGPREPVHNATATLTRTDTVYVNAPSDTVYINRIIYKNVYKPQQPPVITVVDNDPPQNTTVGVSMKEKEELDNLLVSGSE